MHAKYRKNVVDTVLCGVFAPHKPALEITQQQVATVMAVTARIATEILN